MTVIKGNSQHDLRTYRFEDGYTLQENMLLRALKMQAQHGLLMTNPVIGNFKLDNKAPKTCKNLYKYLVEKGYYESINR